MKRGVTNYYYLISCPSDVQEELKIIRNTIDEVNMTIGDEHGVNIKCLYWKSNAIPAAGDSGQDIINRQLLNKADGVIALFWTKFGTPTAQYGSGTEEEIEKAILQRKNVMLYFSHQPIDPTKIDYKQYARVNKFKKRYRGFFAEYNSLDDFRQQFNRHIQGLISELTKKESLFEHNSIGQNMSLAEIMECGWFIRRFLFELPVDKELIPIFQERMNKMMQLANRFEILNDEKLNVISSTKTKAGNNGLYTLSKEDVESSHEIFLYVEASLIKKLKNKENASFQMGRCLGHISMLTEIMWSDDEASLISDLKDRYSDDFQHFINESRIATTVLNKDVEATINFVEQAFSDEESTCKDAMSVVHMAAERIATILALLSE